MQTVTEPSSCVTPSFGCAKRHSDSARLQAPRINSRQTLNYSHTDFFGFQFPSFFFLCHYLLRKAKNFFHHQEKVFVFVLLSTNKRKYKEKWKVFVVKFRQNWVQGNLLIRSDKKEEKIKSWKHGKKLRQPCNLVGCFFRHCFRARCRCHWKKTFHRV